MNTPVTALLLATLATSLTHAQPGMPASRNAYIPDDVPVAQPSVASGHITDIAPSPQEVHAPFGPQDAASFVQPPRLYWPETWFHFIGGNVSREGITADLMEAGVVMKPAFCGPCFGAGDVPSNNGLSIRHTTRNFPNREGSKPGQGQLSLVALMDARSIAATAANGGIITAATDVAYENTHKPYQYDDKIYKCRVYNGFGKAHPETELRYGPNIKDWPTMYPMAENMLVELAAVIHDPVTTTDELIPSGETSSYRSNPLKLSEFALSRRVPEYVGLSKAIQQQDLDRRAGNVSANVAEALKAVGANAENTSFGSCVFANRPGDGSAREQAASCQKVLGGDANICYEYATKRYRSNCINWGIVPFTIAPETIFDFQPGDKVFIPGIREAILEGKEEIDAQVITANGVQPIHLFFQNLTANERQILADGCLMNYYKNLK